MRLDHLLSKEHHQLWWPSSYPSVVGVVAQGWNINGWALHRLVVCEYGSLWGSGKCVAGWFEVETRYWVVRLHAAPRSPGFLVRRGVGGGCGVCGWSSPVLLLCWQGGAGVGLFLENCIVDASIL